MDARVPCVHMRAPLLFVACIFQPLCIRPIYFNLSVHPYVYQRKCACV